ncbi:OLC1v1019478C1 [Oldenlandia corymbosa var. corymbosa]|uniref:OLC1v1019478C1 n=1 Tax=Oldenlandia corymbosa var. corymbosa TaxID=529605 RepID=A0AAV1EE14_OLDCO|nr:OLC1v1019478C1 [Oldenlandia corymbosa var. corymbosa]
MKPPMDFFADLDEHSAVAMDLDDADSLDFFGGEGPLAALEHHRLADADFFNSFQDDFDDSDIN